MLFCLYLIIVAENYKSVQNWYQNLSCMDNFKNAVDEATENKGLATFKVHKNDLSFVQL